MPQPVSVISKSAWAVEEFFTPGLESIIDTCEVLILSTPPEGMASHALTARFIITCSILPGSTSTGSGCGLGVTIN